MDVTHGFPTSSVSALIHREGRHGRGRRVVDRDSGLKGLHHRRRGFLPDSRRRRGCSGRRGRLPGRGDDLQLRFPTLLPRAGQVEIENPVGSSGEVDETSRRLVIEARSERFLGPVGDPSTGGRRLDEHETVRVGGRRNGSGWGGRSRITVGTVLVGVRVGGRGNTGGLFPEREASQRGRRASRKARLWMEHKFSNGRSGSKSSGRLSPIGKGRIVLNIKVRRHRSQGGFPVRSRRPALFCTGGFRTRFRDRPGSSCRERGPRSYRKLRFRSSGGGRQGPLRVDESIGRAGSVRD